MVQRAGVLEGLTPRDQARRIVLITGRDGYIAALALAEISPEFEGKQVILADSVDGQRIDPESLRVVVPGDKRGGRRVHEIVRISVVNAQPTPR